MRPSSAPKRELRRGQACTYGGADVYRKELFSVYPDGPAETRSAVDGKVGFLDGFSVLKSRAGCQALRPSLPGPWFFPWSGRARHMMVSEAWCLNV